MKLTIIAAGDKMPRWVDEGVDTYCRRLPREWGLQVLSVSLKSQGKTIASLQEKEKLNEKLVQQVPKHTSYIALDEKGKSLTTQSLADTLANWLQLGENKAFIIGGPEGLSPATKHHADALWSLSTLTLPHPLVRVLFIEQLYRAYTLLTNHPYHRA